jgi:hypothetical protein
MAIILHSLRKKFMTILRGFILMMVCVVCLSLALPTQADTIAVVEAVQKGATFQRQPKERGAIMVGTQLHSGDIITTGDDARVLIRFSDDSQVRIGAQAEVEFAKNEGMLTRVFKVLKGVFRFSSGKSRKSDVKIHVGNSITVGIRGTDVYTEAQVDKDIVCLIEGKVSVQAGNLKTILSQQREGLSVSKLTKDPRPLIPKIVSKEQFQKWLEKSELQ